MASFLSPSSTTQSILLHRDPLRFEKRNEVFDALWRVDPGPAFRVLFPSDSHAVRRQRISQSLSLFERHDRVVGEVGDKGRRVAVDVFGRTVRGFQQVAGLLRRARAQRHPARHADEGAEPVAFLLRAKLAAVQEGVDRGGTALRYARDDDVPQPDTPGLAVYQRDELLRRVEEAGDLEVTTRVRIPDIPYVEPPMGIALKALGVDLFCLGKYPFDRRKDDLKGVALLVLALP